MKGMELKEKLLSRGYTITYIANKLGTIPQNLNSWFNSQDVRSGTIEKLAEVLELPIAYFYGEAYGNMSQVSGNNNATGSHNTVNASDDRLLDLLVSKDAQLTMAMQQTSKAQEQTDKAQNQMEMLIKKICD